METSTGIGAPELTEKHARIRDDEEGSASELINQGGAEHCGKQIKDLNGA